MMNNIITAEMVHNRITDFIGQEAKDPAYVGGRHIWMSMKWIIQSNQANVILTKSLHYTKWRWPFSFRVLYILLSRIRKDNIPHWIWTDSCIFPDGQLKLELSDLIYSIKVYNSYPLFIYKRHHKAFSLIVFCLCIVSSNVGYNDTHFLRNHHDVYNNCVVIMFSDDAGKQFES